MTARAEHDAHPLLDLMARPNPRQDSAAFLESVVAHLQIAGNAYIEAVTLDGRPRELYALRPDRMRVVPGSGRLAGGLRVSCGGTQRAVRTGRRRCRRSCI